MRLITAARAPGPTPSGFAPSQKASARAYGPWWPWQASSQVGTRAEITRKHATTYKGDDGCQARCTVTVLAHDDARTGLPAISAGSPTKKRP